MSTMRVPDTSDAILRPRLNPVLDMIPQKKLTLVVAGPGYGKTTLVAQAMVRLGLRAVWYHPDPGETDFLGFITSLVRGIQGYYPGFWKALGIQEDNENAFFQMDSAVAGEAFLTEMKAHVTSDLFLVVDDCQVLGCHPEVNAFFQSVLDRLLPFVHLILISRVLAPLKLSRLMAERQVIQVVEADLAFTASEIRLLFSQLFDIVLPEGYIDLLYRKTGGWVSGLVLFYHSLRKKTGPEVGDAIASLNGSQRYLFNYFKENVFDSLPEEKQAFMLRTAILSRPHFEFCNRFLSINNARAILCELEDGHCFTFSVDEDRQIFFYHRLFQEFLQDRLKHRLDPEEINRLYKEAAILYEREDQGQEALQHHILAGNMADASRLLNRFARPIIKQDRPQMVKSLLSIIPAQYMDEEPWFQYLEAGYLGLCRRLQLAARAYEKVLKVFRSQQDEQGECLCLMELAEYYLAAGELKHGTLALISEGTLVCGLCPNDYTYQGMLLNLREVKARKGVVIGISDKCDDVFDYWIPIPTVGEVYYPIVCIVVAQLLAYWTAVE
ncbi:MAG: SIS domain-containing protein, partial [Proteobacteria bacterium]|nr:SIS domain-containing protein [Pseudomonadota bacterium]